MPARAVVVRSPPISGDALHARFPADLFAEAVADADLLFMSNERLTPPQEAFVETMLAESSAELVVLGLGAPGNLAMRRGDRTPWHTPAVDIGPAHDSTGAGDMFLAAVVHYLRQDLPLEAVLQRANAFAAGYLARQGGIGAHPTADEGDRLLQYAQSGGMRRDS